MRTLYLLCLISLFAFDLQAQETVETKTRLNIVEYKDVTKENTDYWINQVCPCMVRYQNKQVPNDQCDCTDFEKQTYINISMHFIRPKSGINFKGIESASELYVDMSLRYPLDKEGGGKVEKKITLPLYEIDLRNGQFLLQEIPEGVNLLSKMYFKLRQLQNASLQIQFYAIEKQNVAEFKKYLALAKDTLNKVRPSTLFDEKREDIVDEEIIRNITSKGRLIFQTNNSMSLFKYLGNTPDSLLNKYSNVYVISKEGETVHEEGLTITGSANDPIVSPKAGGIISFPHIILDYNLLDYFDSNNLPSAIVTDANCTKELKVNQLFTSIKHPVLGEYQRAKEQDLIVLFKAYSEYQQDIITEISGKESMPGDDYIIDMSLIIKHFSKSKINRQFMPLYEAFLINKKTLEEKLKYRNAKFRQRYLSKVEALQGCFENLFEQYGIDFKRVRTRIESRN